MSSLILFIHDSPGPLTMLKTLSDPGLVKNVEVQNKIEQSKNIKEQNNPQPIEDIRQTATLDEKNKPEQRESDIAQLNQSQINISIDSDTNLSTTKQYIQTIRVLLIPKDETTLSSQITGLIKNMNLSLGSSFEAGQHLIEFDNTEQLARLKIAEAELNAAIEAHEAKIRLQGLKQASDVEVELAAYSVAKARAQVDLYKSQLQQCVVIAPWSGWISKIHVRPYMTVSPGQPLLDIIRKGPLKLKLNIPSVSLIYIKKGQIFEVYIDETNKSYKAQISAINSRIDSVSQTIEIEANMLENYPDLLPGMSGTVDLSKLITKLQSANKQ